MNQMCLLKRVVYFKTCMMKCYHNEDLRPYTTKKKELSHETRTSERNSISLSSNEGSIVNLIIDT